MADYGTIKVNKVTYKNGSDADTNFNFKTDIVSATSPDFTTDITLKSQAPVKFEDDSGGEYVGLKAPTGVTTYTVTLPSTAPSNGKVLKATSATALEWGTDTSLTLLDEDNFATDSATAAASQQSIKAYGAATYQALDTDTAKTDVDQSWTKPQRGDISSGGTHSSGTDHNFDLDVANNFKLDIDAAVKLNFTNLDVSRVGQTGTIWIDNAGVTPTWGDEVQFEGGTTLSITQNAKSLLAYYVLDGGADVLVTAILDIKDDYG
jgi:hypothetical protein